MPVTGRFRALGFLRSDAEPRSSAVSAGHFAAALDLVTDPVLLFRMPSLDIVWANRAARQLSWEVRQPLCGRSLTTWAKAAFGDSLAAHLEASQRDGELRINVVDRLGKPRCAQVEYLSRGGSDEPLGALVLLPAAVSDDSGGPAHGLRRDWLTGLFDREALAGRAAALAVAPVSRERWCALYFLDVDEFKSVNDKYGHLAGDEVLRVLAQRLLDCLRPDDLVVRFGGDEFVFLVAGLEFPDEADRIMARIAAALAAPVDVNGRAIEVRVSIGLALGRQSAIDLETLLDQADRSMYRAKARSHREPSQNVPSEERSKPSERPASTRGWRASVNRP